MSSFTHYLFRNRSYLTTDIIYKLLVHEYSLDICLTFTTKHKKLSFISETDKLALKFDGLEIMTLSHNANIVC